MNDEPLILLHGWGMNARVFEPLVTILENRQQLINPNLPGYGDSHWDASLNFDQQVEQMAQDLPSGRLLGWSMGGLYAIELVTRYPKKFSQLTLVCCNPCFVKRPDWDCAVGESVFDEFCEQLTRGWESTIRRFLSLQMLGETRARGLIRDLSMQIAKDGEPDARVLRFGLDLLKQQDVRSRLQNYEQPISLILGERDVLVPIALSQQISDVNPRIQVESLAGAAHAPFLSHTVEFASLLNFR